MKKAINYWAFDPQKEILQNLKGNNFPYIELNYDNQIEKFLNYQKALKSLGVRISSICSEFHWRYSLSSKDKEEQKQAIEIGKRMIHLANTFNAQSIVIIPGIHVLHDELGSRKNAQTLKEVYSLSIESLLELSNFATNFGITIGVENVYFNGFLNNPKEFKKFIAEINKRNVQVHLDIGNANLTDFPIETWIEELKNYICAIHLKDSIKTNKTLKTFQPLLEGDIDWSSIMRKLKSIKYNGFLILEHSYSNGFLSNEELLLRFEKVLAYGEN